ncbi:RING-H2 finger protein ATL51-like [Chenopodium quinoa]|nr:RING-H2 finger protein ATL51-like [Chenopodium quinoa]
MAALIAVLAAAFLLLFYFTVISKLCRRSRNRRRINRFIDSETSDPLSRVDSLIHDPTRPNSSASGLDDAFIRQITVFKYRREDKLVDGTECAVCLTEFNENENLRLMPNCEHAFHLPCIDTWLKTHSNCPLCRSTMNLAPPLRSFSGSGPAPNSNTNSNSNAVGVAALRVERRSNDAVLMIRELEGRVQVLEATQDDEVGSGGCGNFQGRETKLEINDDNNTISNNTGNNNDNSR